MLGGGLLAISPHCDAVVFASGGLLSGRPGAIVATVFAGRPAEHAPLTEWDRAAGFLPGDDVMALRRAEDHAALSLVHARPLWFDFRDAQYGASPPLTEMVEALNETIRRIHPEVILAPMGLFHSDHVLTHEAAVELIRRHPATSWTLYEDTFYRRMEGLVAERGARGEARGFHL